MTSLDTPTGANAANGAPPMVIHYPEELPVSQMRGEIADVIRDNQVVIVAGETGSGKTTQLPKILLELGRQSIGHTQPRRIAARTIAERIAEELGEEVGGLVGYQVRFTDRVGQHTKVKLMTDGILLNEIHRDRTLKKYDAIIIDEAHERSLTIDFLLGYLKQLLPRRPDLKVIITSATIDPESFSKHFDGAPIVSVSGRTFPVEVRYRPLVPDAVEVDAASAAPAEVEPDLDPIDGINAALDELARESSGDVLVFLSGENEIRDAEEAIRGRNLPGTEVLPLYGRLSAADQHKVFRPSTGGGVRRRIVLATNVAETSLTVPGIRYVIDAGMARISRYSVRSKVQRLPIEAISQASAMQRSGRSGRTSDGIAIRLYSELDLQKRPEYTEPEILRTNLAAVILQMISLGLGDIAAFPFLQPPDSRGIKDGLDLLSELGAVRLPKGAGTKTGPSSAAGATHEITAIGKQLAQLPIDPRLARMVIESKKHGTTREVMAIVAALSIQDPRERPLEKRAQADQQHARFTDPTSDFLTLLNLWNYTKEKERELSSSAFRRLCKAEYLNFLRIREWGDVYRQLQRMAKPLGLTIGEESVNPAGIHKSLLAGLLSQIGIKDVQKKDYIGARQVRFLIFPGSALAKKQPDAVMSSELVETSRLFARVNAAIDPAWAESLAGDLVKRSYSEPHWEKKQGAVVAHERVTLYGVPLVQRRPVQFSRVDPAYARELFIRHALVEGDWDLSRTDQRLSAFERANKKLRKELTELEERTRRRDILVDDEAVFEFYHRRLPATVFSARSFETWWRKARVDTPDLLTMTAENLVDEPDETRVDENAFPSTWQQGDQKLKVKYRFEPGADDDGVTVMVPLALLARLSPAGFDWQVPGLREELVTALIKSLPKAIRRNVVPAADWSRRLLEGAAGVPLEELEETSITAYLAEVIRRKTHTPVDVDDFDTERLPPHLRITFAVIDDNGRQVAHAKDLESLQHKLKTRARETVAKVMQRTPHSLERAGLTTWDFDELPKLVDTRQAGSVIRGFPTLVDDGASVSIRVMSTPADQALAMPGGIRRLLLLTVPSPLSWVRDHLSQKEKLTLAASPYQNVQALFDDCLVAVMDAALREHHPDGLIWTRDDFEAARTRISAGLIDSLYAVVTTVTATIAGSRDVERAISQATSMTLLPALSDVRTQLAGLIYPGFVSRTGVAQLQHLPRYLRAIVARLERLPTAVAQDRVAQNEVATAFAKFAAAGGTVPLPGDAPARLVRVRWLLEELRVSLFAQQLRTAEPVSVQRITKALAADAALA
ncbi:ATP-dependent RNA helicase HrpA [Marisediminicola senii]|uniref:ATP-dependent RNA helicase HrpA n=1 Tax=Marisediminicola senii TaxID=2711233 RepID=UPI0013EDD675|nr:ATP-dependent RNA helicase HrpA [Marisediminicola senii]